MRIKPTYFGLSSFYCMFLKDVEYCLFMIEICDAWTTKVKAYWGVINLISHLAH